MGWLLFGLVGGSESEMMMCESGDLNCFRGDFNTTCLSPHPTHMYAPYVTPTRPHSTPSHATPTRSHSHTTSSLPHAIPTHPHPPTTSPLPHVTPTHLHTTSPITTPHTHTPARAYTPPQLPGADRRLGAARLRPGIERDLGGAADAAHPRRGHGGHQAAGPLPRRPLPVGAR